MDERDPTPFEDFVSLVKAMRLTQSAYFKTRDHNVLKESKALERKVDAEIHRLAGTTPQPSLF